jgi:iron-sulfur cluster assembly accessory protein
MVAAALAAKELTCSKELSKFARDWRIAMGTTQNTTSVTLTLTETAAAEVRKFMAEENVSPETAGLRIAVLPGGCSGFRYSLNIEDKPADDDVVIDTAGVRCFVDGFSAQYLNGVTLDYKSTFQESGFAFENPNATGGCGCGSSFTV